MAYKAEYIWIDGTEPTARLRSKTKILDATATELPIWGFDGSSTNQAPGDNSDCVLKPVFVCPDPIRGGDNVLVMCEVLYTDMTPHATNTACAAARRSPRSTRTRSRCSASSRSTRSSRTAARYGFPDERLPRAAGLLLLRRRRRRGVRPRRRRGAPRRVPRGRPRASPASTPRSCPASGSSRSARSARSRSPTSCGSPAGCSTASPRTSASRPRSTRSRSRATGTAPARTPTSPPRRCARATTRSSRRARRSAKNAAEHVEDYGAGIEDRLTGQHETAPWNEFSYGVSDRGASVRIPWQVEVDKKGYIEDRRPERQHGPVRGDPPHHRHGLQRARRS